MVTMTEENGKQPLSVDTEKPSPDNEPQALPSNQTDAKSAHHNFRSMADLLRAQECQDDSEITTRKLDIAPVSLRNEKSDENENSVQDLRLNGQRNDCSSLAMREEHLRRWCNGDLGNGVNDSGYMVDVDGESSHSGIPSELSSEPEHHELGIRAHCDINKTNDAMDADVSAENATPLKLSSPSDGDNISDADHDMRKSKRKQYTPKQRDIVRSPGSLEPPGKVRKTAQCSLQEQLYYMQKQLAEMQSKVLSIGVPDAANPADTSRNKPELFTPGLNLSRDHLKTMQEQQSPLSPLGIKVNMSRHFDSKSSVIKNSIQTSPTQGDTPKDLVDLAKTLKTELSTQMGTMVDTIMAKYAESLKNEKEQKQESPKEQTPIRFEHPVKDRTPLHSHVTPHHPPISDRPVLNLSPRILSEQLQRNPCTNILENMKHFPFAYHKLKQENEKPLNENKVEIPKPQKPFEFNKKLVNPYFDPGRAFADFPRPAPWFPHLPFYPPAQVPTHSALHAAFGAHLGNDQEQTEALPLVVSSPKKKRTKVTDTRLSPRAARALLQEPVPAEQPMSLHASLSPMRDRKEMPMPPTSYHNPLVPASLPTSVAIPNPSLHQSDLFNLYGHKNEHMFPRSDIHNFLPNNRSPPVRDDSRSPNTIYTPSDSPSMFKDSSSYGDHEMNGLDGYPMTTTLTPMHLRKAKLMFFFVRYPSSSILKVFFPDVKFNKNNTAQLVKWFSNFREFFYIQMEKYARQAIAEGVKSPEDLFVTIDSELYRVLNLHYNRNNQLEVPEGFRVAVQATLREFYKAVGLSKDTEQSWKKPIYKVIARMDDAVPEFFKSANWMEQLNDM